MTILINEDSLATIGSRPDMSEHLIGQYGAQNFLGQLETEPPQQTT